MVQSTVIRTTVDVEFISIAKPETYDVYTCIVYTQDNCVEVGYNELTGFCNINQSILLVCGWMKPQIITCNKFMSMKLQFLYSQSHKNLLSKYEPMQINSGQELKDISSKQLAMRMLKIQWLDKHGFNCIWTHDGDQCKWIQCFARVDWASPEQNLE